MIFPAPDHCYRAARAGCGCFRCVEWRKALAAWRATKTEQLTLTEANR